MIQDTPEVRNFLRVATKFYSESIDLIIPPDICLMVTKFRHEKRRDRRLHSWYTENINVITFDFKNIKSLAHLEHCVIHEIVHARYPKLPHGQAFQDLIRKLKINLYKRYFDG